MQAEYPDTKWGGLPRAYGTGRDGKAVRLSVIHYTAGSESRTSAEGGAAYDKRRTDGTSCHVFHDPDSSVQEVLRKDRANSAFHRGNRLGIQHELCGTVQTRAQWLDAASDAILWRAARAVAKDCVDFGLEPRRLSVAEVRAAWYQFPNGPRGICGHVDITRAFPEDGGTHTDPGDQFPWDIFLARVRQCIGGASVPLAEGDPDMIKVLAVPRSDQVHYLGLIAGGRPVPIGNNTDLERWRALARAALQPTDLSIPADLYDAAFPDVAVPDIPGGEQLAGVVAAAIDSRVDLYLRKLLGE